MLRYICAAILLQVALGAASFRLNRREWVIDEGSHLRVCLQQPIDLGIVLDSSSSIRNKDFEKGKEFLQDFVSQYSFGSGSQGVRMSIITFGKGIYPEDSFNLTTYGTKEEVVEAIGNVPHRAGLYTDTGKAIEFMREHQLSRDLVRPQADRISIVITDGNSQLWKFTKEQAELAREDGIMMYAIGVGPSVRDEELMNIAGDPSRVTKVENYEELKGIKEKLAKQTCVKKEKPTTTPPPMDTCGELNPSDVYFVFSPASLGNQGTAWTTSFISQAISAEDMDIGFQYGAITETCPESAGFDLDEYDNVDDIKTRLQSYERSRMPFLVEQLINDGYTEERGARSDAGRVAVLVASNIKGESLNSYVEQLQSEGVRVIVADPFDQGLTIPGATVLYGRSAKQQAESLIGALCPQ